MTDDPKVQRLGAMLRTRRREQRLSLRDLAAKIGVSLNTLSRVERGPVPDLRNFQRIVDWLDVPADSLLVAEPELTVTPEVIARHLRADQLLSAEAAARISEIVARSGYICVLQRPSLQRLVRCWRKSCMKYTRNSSEP